MRQEVLPFYPSIVNLKDVFEDKLYLYMQRWGHYLTVYLDIMDCKVSASSEKLFKV